MAHGTGSSRREFLRHAAAASTAFASPMFVPARVLGLENGPGANEQITIGVIGVGGRARQLIDQIPSGGRVVALSDCYLKRATDAAKERDAKWNVYQDYQQMLDREKLDAALIATPDHVRTLPCIHAVQAGLDVYAEKPLTVYVREGRTLVDAVRRHNRIFQVGTQQRTMEINRFCCEFIRDGKIGAIKVVEGVNYTGPRRYEGLPEEPVPETDDWNAWCGPTRAAAIQQPTAVRLDAVARLFRRRDDQLGSARRRSDSVGAGQRPHGADGTLAGVARSQRRGGHALCRRHAGALHTRPGTDGRGGLYR